MRLAFLLTLGLASIAAVGSKVEAQKCPPETRIDAVTDDYAGKVVPDPYQWLEDQSNPETRAWIDAQNACTDASLSKLAGRSSLAARLTELIRTETYSLPVERAGRYFFTKNEAGQDLALIHMRRGRSGQDEVLVDPLPWTQDHSASATLEAVSLDGRLLFYGRREGGQDEITLHVLDVDAHRELPDVLPAAVYFSVDPSPNDKGIYYTKATPAGPRAYYHALGTTPSEDTLIFGRDLGQDKILLLDLSEDGAYGLYTVSYGAGSEQTALYVQDLKHRGPVVRIIDGIKSRFLGFWADHTLYIQTNWQAPRQHVLSAAATNPAPDHWREVIPQTDAQLDAFLPVGGKLVAEYLRDATSQVKVFDADGKNAKSVTLPSLGTATISGRWKSSELFYDFTSFSYPTTNFVYDLTTGKSAVWSKLNVPMDPDAFETKQVWYESKDHTRVSLFLFYKKGLKRDSTNPVLLTGYGGFGVSETPFYLPLCVVWAEHGGILAVANLRGGGEYGEEWHRAGMFEKKQNVFDDFIAAAGFLISEKYTTRAKLAIIGASNGGLLVGAAITQRPDLFRAAVCLYPLLDMLRYQKFLDGPYWVSEYGSSDDPKQFAYLYKYSPYANAKMRTGYPAVLFVTGDGDTRVAPLHARKMAAQLQASTTSSRPILLLYDTKSGHSGGRPLNKIIAENTDILSFMFWQLGVSS